jgi:hypothetical protein
MSKLSERKQIQVAIARREKLAVKEIKEGNYLKNLEGQPLLYNGLIIDDRIFDQAKKAEVTQWILTNK